MSCFEGLSSKTYDKCQKILRMFSGIENDESAHKNSQARPNSASKSKHNALPYYISKSTAKKSSEKNKFARSRSAHKSTFKNNFNPIKQYQSTSIHKDRKQFSLFGQKTNSSFVSCYKKQSRLDQIMKLKVNRPTIKNILDLKTHKKSMLLNKSLSSLNSSRSSLNKQNISRNCNKESRLQKIMSIKVQKPKVNSTLVGYEPKKSERSTSKSSQKKNSFFAKNNLILQLKQCKKKIRKSEQISEKQQRLWKLFQRQREQQVKKKRYKQQQNYKHQRRKEQKFQKLVQKQLKKIQNNREITLRTEKIFSPYIYPAY